jgi:hypothetical protein
MASDDGVYFYEVDSNGPPAYIGRNGKVVAGGYDLSQLLTFKTARDICLGDDSTAHASLVDYGDAAYAAFFEYLDAIFNALAGTDRDAWCSHAVTYAHGARVFPLRNRAAHDVVIRDDTNWCSTGFRIDYRNLPTVVIHHHLPHLLQRCFRRTTGRIFSH